MLNYVLDLPYSVECITVASRHYITMCKVLDVGLQRVDVLRFYSFVPTP